MGKGKLFGSGNTGPLNAVKVQEYAYQDIPSNIFVQKLSGYQYKGQITTSYETTSSCAGYVWLTDHVVLMFRTDAAPKARADYGRIKSIDLFYFEDVNTYSSQLWTTVTHPSRTSSLCIQKSQKRFIAAVSGSANAAPGHAGDYIFYTYKYTDSGTFSNELTAYSLTAESLGWNTINIISGEYPSNYIYAVAQDIDGNDALLKLTISSTKITATQVCFLAKALEGELSYFADIDMITSNTTATTYRINRTVMSTIYSYVTPISWFCVCAGYAFINLLDDSGYNYYVVPTTGYQYFEVFSLTSASHTTQKFTTLIAGSSSTYYVPLGIVKDPYNAGRKICLLGTWQTSGVYVGETYDGLTYTSIYSLKSNMSQLSQESGSCMPIVRDGQFIWCFSTLSSYIYYVSYILDQVVPIKSSTDALYGITAQEIKTGQRGKVYVPAAFAASSAAYTTYGLPETLVAQIVDDSVDEIKQEVQNG